MNTGDVRYGFRVVRVRESEELKGTLYEMVHERTGAQLAWLDNKIDNKLFSVTFKTLPWDDTGVFHILEHSVLAGSDRYPVKEPFLDLLKSSMNTFLNAMTFPDKTMYPVSSRNEQDFINLTRVYLDAVFCPAIYHNESIFRQEGWHYEPDEEGGMFYNGVVFNEMKGALSSVDGLLERLGKKALFPDNTYGFESGGDPVSIPDLTYESFLSAHRDFYSPANARFYLDGDVPIDRVLRIIDREYLGTMDFEASTHDIAPQEPIPTTEMEAFYEIGQDDEEEGKTQILLGKVFASWEERKRIMAYSLITSYLADNNESPLTRAILEKGLAENVEFTVLDGTAQCFWALVFKNTDPDKKEELMATVRETLEKILEEGIDPDALEAELNQFEFSLRETEEPSGLIRAIRSMSSWLYGGDPMLYLENDELTKELRADLATGYFESILTELLDTEHTLLMTMKPSKTKGEEDRAKEAARVKAEYEAFTEEEKKGVMETYEAMRLWQDTEDSEEAKATLPVLALSDVSDTPMWTETEEFEAGGVKVLYHELPTNGIVHCNMYFNAADEDPENLSRLSVMSNLMGYLPTKSHDAAELQKLVKKTIGILDFAVDVVQDREDETLSRVYFSADFSALTVNMEAAMELVLEILTETDFTATDIIRENLLQGREGLYQAIMGSGNAFASRRVMSRTSSSAHITERTGGYELFRFLDDMKEHFEEKIGDLQDYMKVRSGELFTRARLLIGETAEAPYEGLSALADGLAEGEGNAPEFMTVAAEEPVREAILIPAGVSYAALGGNIHTMGWQYKAPLSVATTLLTFGYLWEEIRVHGGAYGCSFRAGMNGNTVFSSFRDPQPLNSLRVYGETSKFLKEFAKSGETVDKYIISTIATSEALVGTARKGYEAEIAYLAGDTFEKKQERRREILSMATEDLLAFADMFDSMKDNGSVCVIGNEAALEGIGDDWIVHRL